MLKIILFLCMLFAATALECKISNGVEYVNIRGNLQPDGCPDGLKCVNETCSAIQKSNTEKNDGQREGLPCAVIGKDSRSILVFIEGHTDDDVDKPWTYTSGGCGSKDGKNLTCVGDWGEKWEEECPECTPDASGFTTCSDKCRVGCTDTAIDDDMCDKDGKYARGTCRLAGDDGIAGGALAFVITISCIAALGLIVVGLWLGGCFNRWGCVE